MGKLLIYMSLFLAQTTWSADDQLIQSLQQAYADVQYFEADFTQEKNVKHLSKPLISKGKIKFAKEHGMIWEINHPIQVTTKINQQGIFKTNQFFKNEKVKDVQMKAVADIFSELLSSELDRIESQFTTENVEFDETSNNWQVTLQAKSAVIKKALKALVIKGSDSNIADQEVTESINQGISQIQIIDQTGNKTTINLANVNTAQTLSPELVDVFH